MKKVLSMIFCMLIIFTMCTPMYAGSYESSVANKDSGSATTGKTGAANTNYNISSLDKANLGSLEDKGLTLLGTLQWVGYLVAIGMIIWVGIKYLMSGAGEKAKAKETLVPIVIGAILIAGATWIASTLFTALG